MLENTITLSPREAETLEEALRLFADGGHLEEYSSEEYRVYFEKAVKSLREKAEVAR